MDWKTIITATVIAAIVSGIFSLVVALLNNRWLQKVEKEKREFEWRQFMLTKLYPILDELVKLRDFIFPPVNKGFPVMENAPDQRRSIQKLLYRATPLFSKTLRECVNKALAAEETKYSVAFTPNRTDTSDREWVASLVDLYNVLNECIEKQIIDLFNN
jgi:hypothetical protein